MLVGLLFCAAFVAISFFDREQPDIITSFEKLTGWFAMKAHRGQLTNRPKEKPPEGSPPILNLLQQLAQG